MAVKRYYFSLDPGGASGVSCLFGSDTSSSGSSIYQQETKNITGAAGAVVTIKVTNYFNNNRTGSMFVNDIQKFLNDSFTITLNGAGAGSFVAKVQGDSSNTGTLITAQYTIIGVTIGQIGSPANKSISKTF